MQGIVGVLELCMYEWGGLLWHHIL